MDTDKQQAISRLVSQLSEQGKYHLAAALDKYWHYPLRDYITELFERSPARPVEAALEEAFLAHAGKLGYKDSDLENIKHNLQNHRCIQTAPHVGVTQSSRMLCINWMTSLGLKENEPLIAAYYSGNPFSNSYRPGRITKDDVTHQLIPSRYQDQLVSRHRITDKLVEKFKNHFPEIYKGVEPVEGESFSEWALSVTRHLDSGLLDSPLVYLDMNEVIRKYLIKVLDDDQYVISKILFDQKTRDQFLGTFGDINVWFYAAYMSGKYEKNEQIRLGEQGLYGEHLGTIEGPEKLKELLYETKIVPATLPSFLVFTFLNGMRSFGSFVQIEYLTHFKELWKSSGLLDPGYVDQAETYNLTTGMFSDPHLALTNLEAFYKNNWKPDPDRYVMADLWLPMGGIMTGVYAR